MAKVRQRVLIALGIAVPAVAMAGPKFYADDPIWRWPDPVPAPANIIHSRKINELYDFITNSVAPPGARNGVVPPPARAMNTLGEVPDSAWYTNRHRRGRMSLEELRRGPARGNEPVFPWQVAGAKAEGVTPGFTIVDAHDRRYLVKVDPPTNPEMATAADVVGSKFYYALGFNAPENYIVHFRREQLALSDKAKITIAGRERKMLQQDLERILERIPLDREGRYRGMASLYVAGKILGPFRYEGTRPDDPNDIIPHQDRRDLRGLLVFCSWLNHTDAKSINSLDSLAEENGVSSVRHYLLDFGAILGSDSDMAKNPRFGHEYMIPLKTQTIPLEMVSLGLHVPAWQRADFPHIRAVGHFDAATFEPGKWKPNYPNPAFLNCRPDDAFWAAKQVVAFTDAEIRAMAETGEYSDGRAVEYLTRTIAERRDRIGRHYFSQVLPLDNFRIENGQLRFDDLAVLRGFATVRTYQIHWARYDNQTGRETPMGGESSARLPDIGERGYCKADIRRAGGDRKNVAVYLRRGNDAWSVVGIERAW